MDWDFCWCTDPLFCLTISLPKFGCAVVIPHIVVLDKFISSSNVSLNSEAWDFINVSQMVSGRSHQERHTRRERNGDLMVEEFIFKLLCCQGQITYTAEF